MTFVVNGADWQFDGMLAADVHARVDRFLALLADISSDGDRVWIGDDFQNRAMFADEDLWTLLGRNGRFALEDQLQQELTAWLMNAPLYADEEDWPAGLEDADIAVDAAPPVLNLDLAWAHHSVRAGERMGVLSLSQSGYLRTTSNQGVADVFFALEPFDRQVFWRSILRLTPRGLDLLLELAPRAFPNIYFVEGALAGANDLAGGYIPFRDPIQACFETLSDYGAWIFTAPPPPLRPSEPAGPDPTIRPSNQTVQDRFRGFNITAAPENGNVFDTRHCREAREVAVGGETLYCEWHIKLEAHQNRIHIHAPTRSSGNRVIVGILHEHLPLPGH